MNGATLRTAVVGAHKAAIDRMRVGEFLIDNRARSAKLAVRKVFTDKLPTVQAQRVFDRLAAAYAVEVRATIRRQARETWRRVRLSMMRKGQPVRASVLPREWERAVIPPTDRRDDHMALLAAAGIFAAGLGVLAIGASAGLVAMDSAIDRLSARAKTASRNQGLWAANRSARLAIETGVSHARPLPVKGRIVVDPLPPSRRIIPPVPIEPGRTDATDPSPPNPLPPVANLAGWQVRSVLIATTRPKHRHRNGEIFYYFPRPERNERGMEDCPNPPYESPSEGGVMAWNCLCSIVPVFA